MDSTDNAAYPPKVRYRNRLRTCSVCENPGRKLFRIPPDENRYKKWFSALKWDVPPEKLKYFLANAKVCDRHFSDSCFTSTLRERLIKFACPHAKEDLPSTSSVDPSVLLSPAPVENNDTGLSLTPTNDTNDHLQVRSEDLPSTSFATPYSLPSSTSQCTSGEFNDTETSYSAHLVSSTTAKTQNTSGRLQVTPKTRKIKTLLSNVSKLRKRLYENRSSSRLLGQLQAKLADKPHLYEFIQSQLHMQRRSDKGRRWSPKEKSFALNIYLHSPSAYRILRKYFAFPSKATLHRYTYNVSRTPGFCSNLVKCLKAQSSRMSESEKLCVLAIDEMAIKPGYKYAADLDCVDGFTTFRQNYEGKPPCATEALVFMARGIVKNWKQVLGYYFTSPTDKFSLQRLVLEAIDILQSCELEVVAIVCDQGPKNRGLYTEMKVTTKKPYFFHKAKKIYAIFDPPHLLKSVRNNLKNHGIYYEDTSISETPRTVFANWKHIEDLYQMDSKNEFRACRKLTKKHIAVSGLKKMNVKLAAQVLSKTVASTLSLYCLAKIIEEKGKDTARFIQEIDTLFDSVNSRTLNHQKKELRAVTKNSCHIKLWKRMVPWIEKWNIKSSTGRIIHAPCKNGWILTINAFIGISEDLLKKNKFILTNRFNQDVAENTFSSIRRRGGFRDNPDSYEFRHTIHKVIISNFFKQSSGKNCEDDEAYTLIDFSSFNKKELFDIINSEDSTEESVQDNVEDLNLVTLNSIEENVLCYISGYFAKKYLSSNACAKCKELMVDGDKVLENHTLFFVFQRV